MPRISQLNDGGVWRVGHTPFTHIYARQVFADPTFRIMEKAFKEVLDNTLSGATSSAVMQKQPRYDALILGLKADVAQNFMPLFSLEWVAQMSSLLGLNLLPIVDGGLHHIPKASKSGWIHTDLCSAWIDSAKLSNGVHFADRSRCEYFSGKLKYAEAKPVEYIRAASIIFYLNNEGWQPGDGGETEIYSTGHRDVGPRKTIAPENNSLILFECSPHSHHRLVSNPGRARNCIVLFLHTTLADGLARWGDAINRRSPE